LLLGGASARDLGQVVDEATTEQAAEVRVGRGEDDERVPELVQPAPHAVLARVDGGEREEALDLPLVLLEDVGRQAGLLGVPPHHGLHVVLHGRLDRLLRILAAHFLPPAWLRIPTPRARSKPGIRSRSPRPTSTASGPRRAARAGTRLRTSASAPPAGPAGRGARRAGRCRGGRSGSWP